MDDIVRWCGYCYLYSYSFWCEWGLRFKQHEEKWRIKPFTPVHVFGEKGIDVPVVLYILALSFTVV